MVAGLAFCVAQIGKPSFFGQITTRKAVEDSRKEALRSGAKLYSGQSCGKCGSSVRYASNNKCRDCHKAVIAASKKACEYRGIEGGKESIRACVVYFQAMLTCANSTAKRNESLIRIVVDACNAFMTASERCLDKGNMNRVVLTGDESKTISKAVRIFLSIMPQLQVGLWVNAVESGARTWDNYEKTLELQAG